MQSNRRFHRWVTGLALAVITLGFALVDLGSWVYEKASAAASWVTAKLISFASAAPAKADQLNPAPAERLRSWREQYQARTLKRQALTVTDRWRMCPSI